MVAIARWPYARSREVASNPPLTTVRQPMREVGALAAKVLLDRISGDGAAPVGGRIHLPTTVVERGSVGPPRSTGTT